MNKIFIYFPIPILFINLPYLVLLFFLHFFMLRFLTQMRDPSFKCVMGSTINQSILKMNTLISEMENKKGKQINLGINAK